MKKSKLSVYLGVLLSFVFLSSASIGQEAGKYVDNDGSGYLIELIDGYLYASFLNDIENKHKLKEDSYIDSEKYGFSYTVENRGGTHAVLYLGFETKANNDLLYILEISRGQGHEATYTKDKSSVRKKTSLTDSEIAAPIVTKKKEEVKAPLVIEEEVVVKDEEIVVPVIIEEEEEIVEESVIFTVVETMPEYPGGMSELYKYLANNVEYPAYAKESGIQGRVFVTFVVEADGSISDARVLRGIGGGCDEEALRVIKAMPNWKPGKQRGKAVRVQYNLPISFKLT